MNADLSPETKSGENPASSTAAAPEKRAFLPKWGGRIWRLAVAALFTQFALGSILLLGWILRAMQRWTARAWWRLSPLRKQGLGFEEFLAGSAHGERSTTMPRWILAEKGSAMPHRSASLAGRIRSLGDRWLGGLWLNTKRGFGGMLNLAVVLGPASVLWAFGWYDGWNTSFHKGYEEKFVGPILYIIGMLWFCVAMLYVPMAQARQASTGRWRSFYEFSTVWKLIRQRSASCLILGGLTGLLSIPVMIWKVFPQFLPSTNTYYTHVTNAQSLLVMKWYYFWGGALVVACFLTLRWMAARVYAGAVVAGVRSGALVEDDLAEVEWERLHRLELLETDRRPPRHVILRAAGWAASKMGRATIYTATFLIWLLVATLPLVTEFLMKSPGNKGWLNQPLVQLPYFNYIPGQLRENAAKNPDAFAGEDIAR